MTPKAEDIPAAQIGIFPELQPAVSSREILRVDGQILEVAFGYMPHGARNRWEMHEWISLRPNR
ncbi:hypothetical protein WA026_015370, partial [Henosepilachna vigintioctopunctata]